MIALRRTASGGGARATVRRKASTAGLIVLATVGTWSSPSPALMVEGPWVIAAPDSVLNSDLLDSPPGATNDRQQGFPERQGVVLMSALAVDGGTIPAGTVVDSHMIFLNTSDGSPTTTDLNRTWTFSGPVLGVMSDKEGALEVASSPFLGAPGTTYPAEPFAARGLDLPPGSPDRGAGGVVSEGYTADGHSIVVGMTVVQPGDWIRVITRANRAPDCTGVTASPGVLWPPNHKLRMVALSGATDPDGGDVTLTITGVTQDEPLEAGGDGTSSPDAEAGPQSDQVALRAERSGRGDGRVYSIRFVAIDDFGASCAAVAHVGVPHDRAHPATASPESYDSFGHGPPRPWPTPS